MTHGSLFSGIGGFELGAEQAGIKTLWNCEIEEYNRKILKQHFPNSIQYADIRELRHPPTVDIISGGFPCQDLSIAGAGKGITGAKSGLWSEMYRIIDEVRPAYVVIENSPELLKKGFESVLYPLSEIGYDAEWQCLSATSFGLPHVRERVYVIAYAHSHRPQRVLQQIGAYDCLLPETYDKVKLRTPGEWSEQLRDSDLLRTDNVIPKRMDRIRACGNAVIPLVTKYLFTCIQNHYEQEARR